MARRASVIKAARQEAEHLLLLDAGDSLLNDKNPAKSSAGASSVAAMNRLGYQAMALGLVDLANLTPETLQQRQQQADFALLSANVMIRETGAPAAEPYIILDLADHRVAILGLSERGITDFFEARDPIEAASAQVSRLRRQADVVIVLSHAGLDVDRQLAAQIPGIDLIIGGGAQMNQEPLVEGTTGTLILHADAPLPGEAGRAIGIAQLAVNERGEILDHSWERIWLGDQIEDDPEIAAWLSEQHP